MFRKFIVSSFLCFFLAGTVYAQTLEDFLACADYSDRVERVICLEQTLDAAVTKDASSLVNESVTAAEDFGQDNETEMTAESRMEDDSDRGLLPRLRMPSIGGIFGRDKNDDEDDTITEASVVEEPASVTSVENFGRARARVVENEDGREELVDEVADIDRYQNMLTITLASGQVWRQTHSKRYNLRKGDEVRVYPSRWGDSYRLESERLRGFIQVGRVQ